MISLLFAAVSTLSFAAAAAPAAPIADLVTHSSVVIDAPPARIWPFIVDPSAWKRGATLRPAGAMFEAVDPAHPEVVLYRVANVELEPNQRRTLRLETTDGALIGYASWALTPAGPATRVDYDVYTRNGPEGLTPAQVDDNRKRFAAELLILKGLVEGRAAR